MTRASREEMLRAEELLGLKAMARSLAAEMSVDRGG
jgi:hypothetical protein